MKKRNIYALILSSILSVSGCGNDVNCQITSNHAHYYRTMTGIERLISGEKEYRGEYQRYDEYVLIDDTYQVILDNNLCILKDNLEYVQRRLANQGSVKRYEVTYELTPSHIGLIIDPTKEGFSSLTYGIIPEKYETKLEEIAIDEYTTNLVIDESYGLLLYKINDDLTLESKIFTSLEDIEEDYKYFKTGELITKITSEPYYLEKSITKEKN